MELNKNDTKMLQGLSVLAMVWLHLFNTFALMIAITVTTSMLLRLIENPIKKLLR